ncbi:MAG: MoxR-like ATPase [Acidobacteriota bacterium]|jgi:MoxR-like ATPase|nr:MoxR-like ATPase [Acidobacteriota bacterium]
MQSVSEVADKWRLLSQGLDRVIMGQKSVKEQLLVCLLAGGHALLEGVPGTGKTLLALTLSRLLGTRFSRIQFTPDLMPADLLGTSIYNQKTQDFEFRAGPIFADLLLADEINRTPPRTQAALLESMQEKAVTLDGMRRVISPVFTVLATQNPVEFEGTYPLPEAQRDRFLLKISIDYPLKAEEAQMLSSYAAGRRLHDDAVRELSPVLTPDEILVSRDVTARAVRVEENILGYILGIVTATRHHEAIHIGAGPRASLALLESSRALAVLRGRDFVTPDDVKELAGPVMVHRVILTPEAEMEGTTLADILRQIFEKVEVPR